MTWKVGLSRHLPLLRFFACPESPSSRGLLSWYAKNYDEIKGLNPQFQMLLRTTENAMPAVVTELEWTTQDLLKFMIQNGKFRNPDGTIAENRVTAAKEFLSIDWNDFSSERFRSKGFDPERLDNDEILPKWREDVQIQKDLTKYNSMKDYIANIETVFKSGPNDEYFRAENALLMCQRIDLWCAGETEVEQAVIHLYKLGRSINERIPDSPDFITDYIPGCDDFKDH